MDNEIKKLRAEYRRIRARSSARSSVEFDNAVKALLADKVDPTPTDYVDAAKRVKITCRRCAGTGQFITMVENGIPKGPGGSCYRCQGRGYRMDKDERRNYGYDVYHRHAAM